MSPLRSRIPSLATASARQVNRRTTITTTTTAIPAARLHLINKQLSAARYSSMSAPRKFEWLVVVPDIPGTLAKRMEVRATHFADLKRFDTTGNLKMGGALLEEIPADDQPSSLKINGSTLVVDAASKEEIMEMLKSDIYTKEGVWDLEKVQMWPFKCALRHPLN